MLRRGVAGCFSFGLQPGPVSPWRLWGRLSLPKPQIFVTRLDFGLGVIGTILWGLFALVLFVMPGPARLQLLQIGIFPLNHNLADDAAIAIAFVKLHGHVAAKHGL